MTASTDTMQPGQQATPFSGQTANTKPLWAAVGILGVAVLGMGGTLIYNQRTPATPPAAMAPVATVAANAPQLAAPVPAASLAVAAAPAEKPVIDALQPAPVPAPAPVKKVVKHVVKPAPAPAPAHTALTPAPGVAAQGYPSYPSQPPVVAAAPFCAVCGSVESVTPIERSTKPAGVGIGTVAGGVLGAVLGNQVGHGNGRTAATILGAVGGGFAGNAIEGKVRRETVYQVGVRMEDGSRRTLEVAHAPSVGSQVTVQGSTLRTQDGVSYGPKPAAAPVAAQTSAYPENLGR